MSNCLTPVTSVITASSTFVPSLLLTSKKGICFSLAKSCAVVYSTTLVAEIYLRQSYTMQDGLRLHYGSRLVRVCKEASSIFWSK